MAKQLKYYYDLMSQPSRAMYILLKLNKTSFEDVPIALRKAEHLTSEYQEVNRFQKVPCIIDNGFKLSESVAILRYLHGNNKILDKWYPAEIKNRARVDEYLEWQHNNTRLGCAMYFQLKWLKPIISGKEADPKKLAAAQRLMEEVLDNIENIWLESNQFLAGNQMTAADVFAACEIEQLKVARYDAFENRPKLKAWIDKVKSGANPYYDEAHKIINKMAASTGKAKL